MRDGTDLLTVYCFAQNESSPVGQGTLIGDIRSVDPGNFGNSFSLVLSGGEELVAAIGGRFSLPIEQVAHFRPNKPLSACAAAARAKARIIA